MSEDRIDGSDPSESILLIAEGLVNNDRQKNYGHPIDDFARTIAMWKGYLGEHGIIREEDFPALLIMTKLSRMRNDIIAGRPILKDNFVDIAGYAECANKVQNERERRRAKKDRKNKSGKH